ALAARTFVPAPPAKIVGQGLEMLQAALEALKAGVSAAKIVVTLP
ncbi:oxidoreductase, partial [Klebsiella pneumoniae]|nr:oxidoreductase [Escherichia coli]EIW1916164.1 oxidoreductase [Klebsiella pneumoniae]